MWHAQLVSYCLLSLPPHFSFIYALHCTANMSDLPHWLTWHVESTYKNMSWVWQSWTREKTRETGLLPLPAGFFCLKEQQGCKSLSDVHAYFVALGGSFMESLNLPGEYNIEIWIFLYKENIHQDEWIHLNKCFFFYQQVHRWLLFLQKVAPSTCPRMHFSSARRWLTPPTWHTCGRKVEKTFITSSK